MIQNENNKNSYFLVRLEPKFDTMYHGNVNKTVASVEDRFEPVLNRLNASTETYTIYRSSNLKNVVFLFKTSKRKRLALLRNTVNKYFPTAEQQNFKTTLERNKFILENATVPKVLEMKALTRCQFIEAFDTFKINRDLKIKGNLMLEEGYSGKDIKIFEDRKNWYDWQKSLYDMIYEKFGLVKNTDDREVIFIEQSSGNTGKSKFIKYLYSVDPVNIGIIREGNSNQLNSAVYKMMSNNNKKIIFIDLPRTSDQSLGGLANAVENTKNGCVLDHMYGSHNDILFDPPHIVICGNKLPETSFSVDRWKIYTIDKDKKNKPWVDVTKEKAEKLQKMIDIQDKIDSLSLKRKQAELNRLEQLVAKCKG